MKMITTYLTMFICSCLTVSQLMAAASPETKLKLQNKSSEKLDIEVLELTREIKKGYAYIKVKAKILKVIGSATKLKSGDVINIAYLTPTDEARNKGLFLPGDWAKEISNNKKYSAFLNLLDDKSLKYLEKYEKEMYKIIKAYKGPVYRPAAVSASFKEKSN